MLDVAISVTRLFSVWRSLLSAAEKIRAGQLVATVESRRRSSGELPKPEPAGDGHRTAPCSKRVRDGPGHSIAFRERQPANDSRLEEIDLVALIDELAELAARLYLDGRLRDS